MAHSRVVARPDWRLAFDVAPLRARPAGVGIYVRNLGSALAEQLPGRLSLLGVRAETTLAGTPLAGLPATPFSQRHYHAWMQLGAARSVRRSRADLVHFTNAAAPLVGGRPFVLTVHDLSVLRMPRAHPLPRLATVPVTLAAVAAAHRIIVPSQATADELRRLLRVDSRRINVVPHAAEPLPAAPLPDDEVLRGVGLTAGCYVLAPGTIEPRKNHLRLVQAFERLVADGHDLRLVLAGDDGWHGAAVGRLIERSLARARIVALGYVDPPTMGALIRGSAAVCYVSVYEGFGLPVAEAMANGGAVVTSNVSSMPEVAGDAAVMVDPWSVSDIARGMREAIDRRAELVEAGRRRAARRTWRDVARETVAVYEAALGD
jgi:glycosyltransferase involved in cell wall biosynthesis